MESPYDTLRSPQGHRVKGREGMAFVMGGLFQAPPRRCHDPPRDAGASLASGPSCQAPRLDEARRVWNGMIDRGRRRSPAAAACRTFSSASASRAPTISSSQSGEARTTLPASPRAMAVSSSIFRRCAGSASTPPRVRHGFRRASHGAISIGRPRSSVSLSRAASSRERRCRPHVGGGQGWVRRTYGRSAETPLSPTSSRQREFLPASDTAMRISSGHSEVAAAIRHRHRVRVRLHPIGMASRLLHGVSDRERSGRF